MWQKARKVPPTLLSACCYLTIWSITVTPPGGCYFIFKELLRQKTYLMCLSWSSFSCMRLLCLEMRFSMSWLSWNISTPPPWLTWPPARLAAASRRSKIRLLRTLSSIKMASTRSWNTKRGKYAAAFWCDSKTFRKFLKGFRKRVCHFLHNRCFARISEKTQVLLGLGSDGLSPG